MVSNRLRDALGLVLAVPVLGLLLGGVYSVPAMKVTRERDPALTILLGLGLGITVFGIGIVAHTRLTWSVGAWGVATVLLLVARSAYGTLGHGLERFGLVHGVALILALAMALHG